MVWGTNRDVGQAYVQNLSHASDFFLFSGISTDFDSSSEKESYVIQWKPYGRV